MTSRDDAVEEGGLRELSKWMLSKPHDSYLQCRMCHGTWWPDEHPRHNLQCAWLRIERDLRAAKPCSERAVAAPQGHDAAIERINQCFREIEIICDTFGYDPSQWLVIDDELAPIAALPQPSVDALPPASGAQNDTQRRIGPVDRRTNDPNAPNSPYRRMSAGRRAGDAGRRQALLSEMGAQGAANVPEAEATALSKFYSAWKDIKEYGGRYTMEMAVAEEEIEQARLAAAPSTGKGEK